MSRSADEVHDHHKYPHHEHDSLHDRIVAVRHRIEQLAADAGQVEHQFEDDGRAEQAADDVSGQGDGRSERGSEQISASRAGSRSSPRTMAVSTNASSVVSATELCMTRSRIGTRGPQAVMAGNRR